MMSEDRECDIGLPSKEICEERCKLFAEITGTDTALAMFYLQDRDWNLQQSVDAYFEELGQDISDVTPSQSISNRSGHQTAANARCEGANSSTDTEPHRIRLITWNIDGLDERNTETRTKIACKTILKENPDVVYLQEVVPETLEIIQTQLSGYNIIPGGDRGYFTCIACKKISTTIKDQKIMPFPTTKMMRNLLSVKATVKGIPMYLMTSHLESTKDHANERKRQLLQSFKEMVKADDTRTVIFGGDLNMRDPEVAAVGGIPDGMYDLWEVTGKRPIAQWTWDTTRNDNLDWAVKFRPKCRFDRLYMRHCEPMPKLKPVYFELIGLERIPECGRFPSDHWGILTHYDAV